MRRTQSANLREVRRLINLLLKIKRYARQTEALEKKVAFHDVLEMKGVSSLESERPKMYLVKRDILSWKYAS